MMANARSTNVPTSSHALIEGRGRTFIYDAREIISQLQGGRLIIGALLKRDEFDVYIYIYIVE